MSTRAAARQTAAAPARAARPRVRPDARPDARPRPRPRPRAVPRSRRRSGVRLGPLVIPIIALVLGGIVWVNVAKLALTNDTGKVMERSRAVEAQTARLQSQLDRLDARVRENAQKRLGMVMPSGDSVTYLDPLAHP